MLKRHDQHLDQQSVSSFSVDVSSALATAAAAAAAAAKQQGRPCVPSDVPADDAQLGTLRQVYASPFYQPSNSCSPATPKPATAAAALLPPIPQSSLLSSSRSLLRYSTSYSSAGAPAAAEAASPRPSVTPRQPSVIDCSCSRTPSNDASQHGSRELDTVPQGAPCSTDGDAARLVTTCTTQSHQQLQHSPEKLSSAHHPQLQLLLQEPTQHQPGLQQLQPAGRAPDGLLLPAGSALTAYPDVAAAFNSAAVQGWLQGHRGLSAAPQQQQGAAAQASPSTGAMPESPFASPAGQVAAAAVACTPAAAPLSPTAAAIAQLESSTAPEDVQQWLLRAAVLEDELQGRAWEVAEELQAQQERRELFASLASALQGSAAGSAAHEAAVQEAADNLGMALSVGSRGALYKARGTAGGSRLASPGIRWGCAGSDRETEPLSCCEPCQSAQAVCAAARSGWRLIASTCLLPTCLLPTCRCCVQVPGLCQAASAGPQCCQAAGACRRPGVSTGDPAGLSGCAGQQQGHTPAPMQQAGRPAAGAQ